MGNLILVDSKSDCGNVLPALRVVELCAVNDEPHRVDGGLEGTHATPASREVSVSTALSETTVPGASGTVVRL